MRITRLRGAILGALYGGVGMSLAAQGALADARSESISSDVSVPGNQTVGFSTASPLTVLQREDIERSGHVSLGSLLQELPLMGSALNTRFNGGGNGSTFVNLRYLGSDRTLVLLNGRRLAASLGGSVDLNNIPLPIVERVEILSEGASAIYGSDAIAGVINIITRGDFTGLEANAQIGEFDEGDGQRQAYDFSVGSEGDRGQVFFNVSYVKQDSVSAGDRIISAEPVFGTGNRLGSSATPFGRFFDLNSFGTGDPNFIDIVCPLPAPQCQNPANYRPWNASTDAYNFAPGSHLLTPQERTSIFTQGRYQITDGMDFHFEAMYTNRESSQQFAPLPLFFGAFAGSGGRADQIGISGLNPFNPFGVDLRSQNLFIGRRLVEVGPRRFSQDVDAHRISLGLSGHLALTDDRWLWNINYSQSKIHQNQASEGLINTDHLALGLGPVQGCVSASNNCVPINLFGRRGLTTPMVNFLGVNTQETNETSVTRYSADLTGNLLKLPDGMLGLAAGYEHQQAMASETGDALLDNQQPLFRRRALVNGQYTADEVYMDFAVPVMADRPGVELLELSIGSRYSNFGTDDAFFRSRVGLRYKPISDLLFRAEFAEGYNTPSLAQLFQENTTSFPTISDPCSDMFGTIAGSIRPTQDPATGAPVAPDDALSPEARENCIAQGVDPSGQYTQLSAQFPIDLGGNRNLGPEKSEAIVFGLYYRPSQIAGLELSATAFSLELDETVATLGAQNILNMCAGDADSVACPLIHRVGQGSIANIQNTNQNVNRLQTTGANFQLKHRWFRDSLGDFETVLTATYLSRYRDLRATNPAYNDFRAFIETPREGGNFGDLAFPRWKANLSLDWSLGDWEATYGIHYIHHQTESCAVTFRPDEPFQCHHPGNAGSENPSLNRIGATTYHDAQLSYHLGAYDTRITLGVDNLWDKGPPVSTTAFENSFDRSVYRVPGRFGYLRVTVEF